MSRKFLTRKEIRYWFQPIADFCKVALKYGGEVDCVQGYPIVYIRTRKVWGRVDVCLEGLRESLQRLPFTFDYTPFERAERKLKHGVMLEESDVDDLERCLKSLEDLIIKVPLTQVKSAVQTQMIAIELERLKS